MSPSSSSQNDTSAVTGETANTYTVTLTHNLPEPLCTSDSQANCVVAEQIGDGSADPKTIDCPFYSGTLPTQVLAANITSTTFTCTLTGPDSESGPEEIFGEDVRTGTPGDFVTVFDDTETVFLINPTGTGPVVNPTASFTTTQSTTNPLTWSFDASNSAPSSGQTITGYAWNFGDGSTASGQTTSHTYAAGGTYTVSLTVTDADGGMATTTHQVHSGALVVNSTGDLPEVSPADGVCDTGETVGSAPGMHTCAPPSPWPTRTGAAARSPSTFSAGAPRCSPRPRRTRPSPFRPPSTARASPEGGSRSTDRARPPPRACSS